MFNLTGLRGFIERQGIKLLSDRGYSHESLVRPDDEDGRREWNNTQKSLRAVVETVFGLVQNFAVAGGVFRQSPELQELALMIVYHVTQYYLMLFPLRLP